MKYGLVLEGGAMRGLFTAGILDVFTAEGITFDGAVGVSAGAVFGCNFKSGQLGRTLRYNLRFARDPRYCSFASLLLTGDLYGADFCYDAIPHHLDIFDEYAFARNPMQFYIVCTDVHTGKPVYHLCSDGEERDMKYMQGSASMPVASRAVSVDGLELLDGGISDSIPLKFMESEGYEKNIVILTQPASYRKQPQKGLPLMKKALKKYPEIIHDMEVRHDAYNAQAEYVAQREQEGTVLVLRPDEPLGIGRITHDRDALREAYMTGRNKAIQELDHIRAFLKEGEGHD